MYARLLNDTIPPKYLTKISFYLNTPVEKVLTLFCLFIWLFFILNIWVILCSCQLVQTSHMVSMVHLAVLTPIVFLPIYSTCHSEDDALE